MTTVLTFKSVDEILHVLYVITIQMKPLQQYIYFHIVWFQKISIPPPQEGFAVWPPSPLEFPKLAPKIYPPPFQISKIFAHPLGLLLSLIEVNKLVVFFTRVPHFASFMYFLLNSITDKRICHALKLQCMLNKFLATRKWNARLHGKYNYTFLSLHQDESNTWRSINKEIRTSSQDSAGIEFCSTKFAYLMTIFFWRDCPSLSNRYQIHSNIYPFENGKP